MPPLTPQNALLRSENVTASEVGALLGPHPYATPEGIWDRLIGLADPIPPSEAMDTGSFMENAILRLAEKRLRLKARSNQRTFVHPRTRLCATPDAFVLGNTEIKPSRVHADPSKGRIFDKAMEQWRHAEMHGWRVTGWTVGATALDDIEPGRRTEDITHLLGLPVRRSGDIERNAIRAETDR